MNYNQRRTYQQNWHRLLRRYEKKYLPRILKALEGEAKRFIAEAERVGFQTAFRSFGLVNPQLLAVIEQMHKEVGLKFGKDVNRYLTRTQKISFFNANFLLNLVEILTRQALELLTAVETTTKERILQILNRSTVDQLSFVDTANLITEQVANPERALTITRTESNRAANIAAFEAARLQDYEVTKEWISSIDSRTRRYREKDEYDHAVLDGTVQELDQAFQQTGRTKGIIANAQYPLDAQAPAAFTINCRCVLGFENKRDANGNLIPKRFI